MSRVRVEAGHDVIVLIQDLALPKGEWRSGPLEVYVAFGAPGTPSAVDAHLLTLPPVSEARAEAVRDTDASDGPSSSDRGETLVTEPSTRRATGAQIVLGGPKMAGFSVLIRESALQRAYASSDVAILRLRSLLGTADRDASGARGIVVRLGTAAGMPLTLGRIQVVSMESGASATRAEATLCGPDAERLSLGVSVLPKAPRSHRAPAIAPELAVRHASDDLCIRFWTAS